MSRALLAGVLVSTAALGLGCPRARAQPAPEIDATGPSEAPRSPGANVVRRAKDHYLRGLDFATRGSFSAALAEFLASRALHPTGAATMNAAYCSRQLGRLGDALELYREVLREHAPKLTSEELLEVQIAASELDALVGRIRIETDVAGAQLQIDGEVRAETPLSDALIVNPGVHAIRVSKPGYEPIRFELGVASGETKTRRVTLVAVSTASPAGPRKPAEAVRARPKPRRARVLVELAGGPTFTPASGATAALRAGYRVTPRVALELVTGYLRLWRDEERALAATGADGERFVSQRLRDATRFSMPFAGVGASRVFFRRTPLLARISTGLGRARLLAAIDGSFERDSSATVFRASLLEDAHDVWVPFLAPELRFGYRFGEQWTIDLGFTAWFLFPPSKARTGPSPVPEDREARWILLVPDDRSGTIAGPVRLPIEETIGASVALSPSAGVRWEF
jgi:hypothetical protein